MVLRRSVKCLSVFFIIFLMCPKRSRLDTPIIKQAEVFTSARRTFNEFYNPVKSIKTPQWPQYVLRSNTDDLHVEPGFDFTDDEMTKFKLWPKGIIPYYIDVLSFNDKVIRDRIRLFLNEVNTLTKISFFEMPSPPKDDKTRWVFFVNRRGQLGCADHSILNFTNEGVQQVILGYDCMTTGGELTEVVLAIAGVPPQHNSPDRNKYIKVLNENIIPDKKYLFEKLNNDEWLFHDLEYDYKSAGHYHHHKYSVNGHATIESETGYPVTSMGESNGFTWLDLKKMRMLYNYIADIKEDKVPECEKLFKKGQNVVKKRKKPRRVPRKKPKKYLGVESSDEKEEIGTDNEEIEGRVNYKSNSQTDSEAEEEGSTLKKAIKADGRIKSKKGDSRIAKKTFFDPLTYLSDYQTGDDRRRDGSNRINKTK